MPLRTKCTCGAVYTIEQWRALPRMGIVDVEREFPAEPGEQVLEPFELRTCSACRSTVAKPIPYPGGTDYPRSRPVRRRS